MEPDHLNMHLLGSAAGIPPTKRPKLDSTTSEDSEVFGKLLGLDNDLPDEILVSGFLNSTDSGILPELNSTAQPQSQQQSQPAHPAINSSTFGITQTSASNSNPTPTSQINMYNPHVNASDPRFAGLSNANSVPSPQPTAISTSADPTPTLPPISSTPAQPSSSAAPAVVNATTSLLHTQPVDSISRTFPTSAGGMAYSSVSSLMPQAMNSLGGRMNPGGGGQLQIQQHPQHIVPGAGMGSLAMVHHGPQATVVTMRSSPGYHNYGGGGGGGGQYGIPTGGQYANQIRMPGAMRMAMAQQQQHAPPPHMVPHQHGYNPTIHHGVPHAGMAHQMVRNPQQQHMVQGNTMATHLSQPMTRMLMPSQGGMSGNVMGGGVRQFGASVLQQESPLQSLDPTILRTSSEQQGVSPQQGLPPSQQPLQTPTPPPAQLGQPSLHTQPPHPQQQPQQNLSPMGQTQSPSPQRSQQPSTMPTASATSQNQTPQPQSQQQPGEFGPQATHPSTAQLQPQGATQAGNTPLQGLQGNIATSQPLTPPQRLSPQQQQQQPQVINHPPSIGGSTPPPNATGGPTGQTSDPEKRKLIQQQLVLLLHAHKCQRREREQAASGEYRPCTLPHCRTMKGVLNHMTECQAGRSCTYPHCASSRQIISHWKNCQRSDCPVCLPLKHPTVDRPAQQRREPTTNLPLQQMMGVGGGGGIGIGMGPQGVNPRPPLMAPGQALPTGPQYNHVGSPNMPGNMSYNTTSAVRPYFDQQSSAGMPADLAQSRVLYPVPIPNIASRPTQQWHQHVNPDLRQHLVRKLVEAIYPVQDPMALQDRRVASLIQYAMKVEKAMFETATSREEYYQLLAEKIYRIRKELEERRKVKRIGGVSEQNMVNGGDPLMQSPNIMYQQPMGGSPLPPQLSDNPQLPQPGTGTITTSGGSFPLPPTPTSSVDLDKKTVQTKLMSPTSVPASQPPSSTAPSQPLPIEPKAEIKTEIKTEQVSSTPSVATSRNPLPSTTDGSVDMGHSEPLPSVSAAPTPQVPSVSSVKAPPSLSRKNSITDTPLPSSRPATPLTMETEAASSPQMPMPKKTRIQPDPALRKVFTTEELESALRPVFDAVWDQDPESYPFRQPVDPRALGIPDYFNIIKEPMDLSTISNKLDSGKYKTPWEFCRDMRLMFDNAWLYNKKTSRVYKYCTKLTEVFDSFIDEAMQSLGYCCGMRYTFHPQVLYCYGKPLCTIPRDTAYYGYQNSRYVYCPRCFTEMPGDTITVGDDPMTATVVRKSAFKEMKNDSIDYEPMVECIHCSREMHKICVLHHENIWSDGFQCENCLKAKRLVLKENKFSAKRLPTTNLALYLEERINSFLRTKESDAGNVTIRVVSSSDKTLDTRTLMKDRFQGDFPISFPYRTKAMFVFEEIDGVDVCFFGMHVQEYGSDCQAPNTRRVYISYLDSVHFFRPRHLRTLVYHEILIGYLEFCKNNGYLTAHIWACPPSEGDDYIFHCHPLEQKIPKPKRLIDWYRKMLDSGKSTGVVYDYRDIFKHCTEDGMTSVTEIPYFEGDFWPNVIEENIKELDQEAKEREASEMASGEGRGPKKAGKRSSNKKGSKKAGSTRNKSSKKGSLLIGGDDLSQKLYQTMEKHREVFFVVLLQPPQVGSASPLPGTTDPDQLISCDLMDGRDAFLTMSRERHWEFSSLRRAKYSTMAMLYELHNQTSDRFVYTCNNCRMHVETRYHCRECDDFDLCVACYRDVGHIHPMDKLGLGLDDEIQQDTAQKDPREQRKASIQKCIQFLVHASQCRDPMCKQPSCIKMKRVLRHTRDCKLRMSGNCTICKQFLLLCYSHAKSCTDDKCPVPICARIKKNLREQRAQSQKRQNRFMQQRMANMSQMSNNGNGNNQSTSTASPAPAQTPPGGAKNPTPPSKGSPVSHPSTGANTAAPVTSVAPSPAGPRSVGKGGPMTPGEPHTPGQQPANMRMVASSPSSLQQHTAIPQSTNPPEPPMPAPNVTVSAPSGLPGELPIMRVPQQMMVGQEHQLTFHGQQPRQNMAMMQQHSDMQSRVMAMQQRREVVPPEMHQPSPMGPSYGHLAGVSQIQPQLNPMAMQPRPQAYNMAPQQHPQPQLLRAQPQSYAAVSAHPVQGYRPMQYSHQMVPQGQQQMYHHVNPVAQQHHPSQLQAILAARHPTPQHQGVAYGTITHQPHTLGPPPQYPSAPMRPSPSPQTAGYPQVLGHQARPMPTHSPLGQHMSPAMHPSGHTQYIPAHGMPVDHGMHSDPSFMYGQQQPQYGLNSSNNNNTLSQDGFSMLPPQDRLSRFVENL